MEDEKQIVFNFLNKTNGYGFWDKVDDFIQFRSRATQKAYACAIKDLCAYLGVKSKSARAEKEIRSLTSSRAMAYMASMKQRLAIDGLPLAPATVMQRLAVLRSLFAFLHRSHLVGINAFDEAKTMIRFKNKRQKRPTRTIAAEDVRQLLDAPVSNSKVGIRDRALLALLFGAALRRSEALSLRLCDIQIADSGTCLCLRSTKADDYAEQPLADWAAERVLALTQQRRLEGAGELEPVFVRYRHNDTAAARISDRTLARIFARYCKGIKLGSMAPHSARATAITHLLTKGHSYDQVKDFARHKSYTMVEVYDKRHKTVAKSLAKELNY